MIVSSKELFSSPIFWDTFGNGAGNLVDPRFWIFPIVMPNSKEFAYLSHYCSSQSCGYCIFRLKNDKCLLKTESPVEWGKYIDEVKTNITEERSPFFKIEGEWHYAGEIFE